jgi:outer membrane protein
MKKCLLSLSVASLFMVGSVALAGTKTADDVKPVTNTKATASTKIAVLDLNKVLMSSPQLEAAKAKLKKEFDPRGKKIEEAQNKFQNDIQAFGKNSPTMKAEEKKAAEKSLKEEQKKLQELQTSFQKDLESAQNSEMQSIMKRVEKIVAKIAVEKDVDLIVAKSSVSYNKPDLDVTNEVVKQVKK